VIGTDISAEAERLRRKYSDTVFITFGQGGFEATQHRGVQEALLQLVSVLPRDVKKTATPTFNIIGSCADLFRFQADAIEISRIMEGAFGMKPLCVLTSDSSVDDIENIGGAHINLVIRREGESAAVLLQERFSTPYLSGHFYGMEGTLRWIEKTADILGIAPNRAFLDNQCGEIKELVVGITPRLRHFIREHTDEVRLSVGAHADIVRGLIDFGCDELFLPKGTCWCDNPDMADRDIPYFPEEEWTQAIQASGKGLLMASGEALEWADRNQSLQISNPGIRWRLNPYDPPFMGFRGALHLIDLWMNAVLEQNNFEPS
jgi:nitrogenase molybdenum-iron protein alpha/beta subunit